MAEAAWITAILTLYALHFPHILADFPNHSPWMDYAKYTDEGWYGNAATRFTLTGHWFLPGDFNPAVALPVWPVLLGIVFHFTGVSLAAARLLGLLFLGANLLLSYLLLRMHAPRWVALLGISMLAANPFLFAFSRLAILEPPLVCLMLLCWWVALRFGAEARLTAAVPIGTLLCLMVLTKTTGVVLVPSVLFLMAYACRLRLRSALRAIGLASGCAIGLWSAWLFLLIRPHYRADYHYFFQANRWPQPVGIGAHAAAWWWALHGLLWVSPTLCGATVALLAIACIGYPRTHRAQARQNILWRNPLVIASLLALGGYILLIAVQNHPQPRYYALTIYPLFFVLALVSGELIRSGTLWLRAAGISAVVVIFAICVGGALRIVACVRHPEYTWLHAATNLSRTVRDNPAPNHLLLSVSDDEIQLITHLPAICDDYGTWSLADRLRKYHPAWYAAWNEMDEDTEAELEKHYSVHPAASFPAFDDPDRNVLILYRLEPRSAQRQKSER